MSIHVINSYLAKLACVLSNEGISGLLDSSKAKLADHFQITAKTLEKTKTQLLSLVPLNTLWLLNVYRLCSFTIYQQNMLFLLPISSDRNNERWIWNHHKFVISFLFLTFLEFLHILLKCSVTVYIFSVIKLVYDLSANWKLKLFLKSFKF